MNQIFIKNRNRIILLASNALLVFLLILLSNLQILPLHTGDFIFFVILTLALALYRPGWVFLFFVGTIMLENINLAPMELGIAVRPYQFFGGLAIASIIIRLLTDRLNFKLVKLGFYDWMIILSGGVSFVSSIFSTNPGVALKQSIIVVSFIFLYFLVRNYVQSSEDLKKIVPFFLSSSIVVMLYSIWQNVRFAQNLSNFEVMPGRPNGTFTEADWLGIFVTFVIGVIYGLIFYVNKRKDESGEDAQIFNKFSISKFLILKIALYLILTALYVTLILTVSRSAWVGVAAVNFIFLMIVFTDLKFNPKFWQWKAVAQIKIPIYLTVALSVALVYFFNLTSFQLFNRAQSTGTGLQKITVACQEDVALPESVATSEDLIRFGCRHINLEEVRLEEARGNIITETYRKDPNVNIRQEIYKKSWEEIKRSPILGIGWGNISDVLGKDDRGAGLNSSNIFLEVWLGAGILGLLAFVAIWLGVIIRTLRLFLEDNFEMKVIGIFFLLGSTAIIIPNLFNAGILLGYVWLFLGLTFIKKEK